MQRDDSANDIMLLNFFEVGSFTPASFASYSSTQITLKSSSHIDQMYIQPGSIQTDGSLSSTILVFTLRILNSGAEAFGLLFLSYNKLAATLQVSSYREIYLLNADDLTPTTTFFKGSTPYFIGTTEKSCIDCIYCSTSSPDLKMSFLYSQTYG